VKPFYRPNLNPVERELILKGLENSLKDKDIAHPLFNDLYGAYSKLKRFGVSVKESVEDADRLIFYVNRIHPNWHLKKEKA
jgi:hypothetical protein